MEYQEKYNYTFKDITERVHLVEIWQNTEDIIVAEEIKGHMNPFAVEMPEIDNKFQVVRGNGCQINLLSQTDMQFFSSLYHINPTDFQIRHYIDGAINFLGFLNAEMISEPYDIDFNYIVSLTGNDGFSLLDRFSFANYLGEPYVGIWAKIGLLQICFSKIDLPWTEIRIALSTTFTGQSSDVDKTILHESYLNAANFYDEDNKPMSCREVIESILAPLGSHIRTESGIIYISDVHTLASNSSVTYKRFAYPTLTYLGAIAEVNNKAIGTVGYRGTGQNIEMSGGVNRQVVSYSPYPTKLILDQSFISADEFAVVPVSFSTKDGYLYKLLQGSLYWEIDAIWTFEVNPPTFEASYFLNEEETNIYVRWPRFVGTNSRIVYLRYPKYLNISGASLNPLSTDPDRPIRRRTKYYDGVAFQITGQMLTKTKDNPYDTTESKPINEVQLSYVAKVGSRYYDQSVNGWVLTPAFNTIIINGSNNGIISDQFVDFSKLIIIGNIDEDITLDGLFEFEFYSEVKSRTVKGLDLVTNSADIKEIWLSDMSIKIVNYDGSELQDNDIEYIGLLDRTFQNEGDKIELTCGTDSQFADRGKILKSDGTNYTDIRLWTRNAQTFKIEELLLGSICSNYRSGFVTLSNMRLNNTVKLQNIFTDTFLSTKKLMVKSANINYQDHVFECSLIEILPDELIVVKDSSVV